ncbi:MAG: 23S rRNA (pseudouridine(1915)-N(3))-methyltransferase RlmH [Pseudomonadota bacterium]
MRLLILAVGSKAPRWIEEGFQEYAKRVKGDCQIGLKEVPPARGQRKQALSNKREEAQRLRACVPKNAFKVALDEKGKSLKTRDLAAKIDEWKQNGREVAILIGGPDGLDAELMDEADFVWSLSSLTLPHTLVRVVLAEALYRAWSLGHNHPYHRE